MADRRKTPRAAGSRASGAGESSTPAPKTPKYVLWVEISNVEYNQHLPHNGTPIGPILVSDADGKIHKCFAVSGSGPYQVRSDSHGSPPHVWLETDGPLVMQEEP